MRLLIVTCLTGLAYMTYGQTTDAWNYQQALQALVKSKLSAGDMAKMSQQISAVAKSGTPQEIQQKAIDIIRARIAQQAIATTAAPGNDANTYNIQVQPYPSPSSSGISGSSGMGFDPQMLSMIRSKFMEFIMSKNPDTSEMATYYSASYKTEPLQTLLDKFPDFFPKDKQAEIQKLVDQGVENNGKFLDRVAEVAKLDEEFISAAVPILKDTSQTLPEMQAKLQKLSAKYDPVVLASSQALIKPIIAQEVMPQIQAAMQQMGGQGTDEVMYADVMPQDNSDQPVSSDVSDNQQDPTIQEEPPVGGKKAAKAAARAAKKAAKQAAKEAAKKAAEKAAKKAEKEAKRAEKAAKKNAE